ncbi:hypothetical protein J6590_063630 [Homalodisca vitripennis]|nr:hypothetical protein J6590_063630 [Homalodisca vitripennis]
MVGGKLVKTTVFVDDRRVTDETESHVTTFEKKPLPAAGKPSKPVDKFGKPVEEDKIPKEPTDKKPKKEKEEPSGKPAAGVPSKPKSKPEDQIKMVEPYEKHPKDDKEPTKKSPAGTPGKPRDKPDGFQPDKKSRKPGEPEDLFLEPRKPSDTDYTTSETTHTTEVVKMVGGKLVKTTVFVDDRRVTDETESHVTTFEKKPLPAAGKPSKPVDKFGKPVEEDKIPKEPTDKKPKKEKEEPSGKPAAGVPSKPKSKPEDQIKMVEPYEKHPKDDKEPTKKSPAGTPGKPRDKPDGFQPDKNLFLEPRKPSDTDYTTSETTHTTEVVKMVGGKLVKTTVFVDDRRVTDETESHVTTFEKKPLPAAGKPSKPVDKFGKPVEEDKIPKEPTDKKPKKEKEEPSGKPAAGVPSKPKSKPEDQIKMVEPYEKHPKDDKEPTKKSPAGTPGKPRDKPEDLFLEPRKPSDTDYTTSETTHTTEVVKMVGGKLVKTTVFVDDRRVTDETESHVTTFEKKPLPAAGKPSKPVDKFGKPVEEDKIPKEPTDKKPKKEKEEPSGKPAAGVPSKPKSKPEDQIKMVEPYEKHPKDDKEPTKKSPAGTPGKPRDKPDGFQPDKKSRKPGEPEDLFLEPRKPSDTDYTTSETTHTTEVVKMVGGKLVKTTVFVDDRRVTDETESHVTTFEKKPLPAAGKPSKPVDKFGKPVEEDKIPKEPTDKKPKKEKEEPSGKPAAGVPSKPKSKPEDQIKMVEPYEKHPKDDKEPTKKSPAGTPGKPRDKPEDLFLEPRKPSDTDYTTSETTHTTEVVKMVGGKLVKTTVFVDDRRVTDETESYVTTFEKKPLPAAGKPSKPVDKFGKPIEEDKTPKEPTDKKPKKEKEEPSGKPAAGVPSKPKSKPEDQINKFEPLYKHPTDTIEPTKKSGAPGAFSERPKLPEKPKQPAGKPSQPIDKFGRPLDLFEEPKQPQKPQIDRSKEPEDRIVPLPKDEPDRVSVVGTHIQTSKTSTSSTVVQEATSASTESIIRKGVRRIITDKGVVEEILPETVVIRKTSDAEDIRKQSFVVHEDTKVGTTVYTTHKDVREIQPKDKKPLEDRPKEPKEPKDKKPKEPTELKEKKPKEPKEPKPAKEQCICEICTCG